MTTDKPDEPRKGFVPTDRERELVSRLLAQHANELAGAANGSAFHQNAKEYRDMSEEVEATRVRFLKETEVS